MTGSKGILRKWTEAVDEQDVGSTHVIAAKRSVRGHARRILNVEPSGWTCGRGGETRAQRKQTLFKGNEENVAKTTPTAVILWAESDLQTAGSLATLPVRDR